MTTTVAITTVFLGVFTFKKRFYQKKHGQSNKAVGDYRL
jgi:hypothetical protein